jgi:hypothetical protein
MKKVSDDHGADYRNVLDWAIIRIGFYLGNFVNNVHAVDNLAKDRMFAVEEVVVDKIDEELTSSGIWPGVCHRDCTPIILVFVRKLVLDDITRPAPAGAGWITPLDHKSIDHPVEYYTVIIAFFNERFKIARGDGHVRSEGNCYRAHIRLKLYQFLCFC